MALETAASGAKLWIAALLLTSLSARAADPVYKLSLDEDRWADEFSVFHMDVKDEFGAVNSSLATSDDPRLHPVTRLDTSWTFNAPVVNAPVRLGDTVASTALWAQPVRMGGLQIGTLQPVLPGIILPPILLAPEYVGNGAAAAYESARVIEQVSSITQFQKPALIAPGQAVYSFESGRVRQDFELRSNGYGAWLTSGTYRYGAGRNTTVDGQFAQVGEQQTVIGFGLLEGLGPLGLISARIAGSRDIDSNGWLARMGYDFTHDNLSFTLRSHIQSVGYQSIGDSAYLEALRQRTLASAGMNFGSLGKISVASATQTLTDDSRSNVLALSHAIALIGGGILSTAAAYSPGQIANTVWAVSVTFPFNYEIAPARQLAAAGDMVLDRTLINAFNLTRIPTPGRLLNERLQLP